MLESVEEAIVVAYKKELDNSLRKFSKMDDSEKIMTLVEFLFKKQNMMKFNFYKNKIQLHMYAGNGELIELCTIDSSNLFDVDIIFSIIIEKLKNLNNKDYKNSYIIHFIDEFCSWVF